MPNQLKDSLEKVHNVFVNCLVALKVAMRHMSDSFESCEKQTSSVFKSAASLGTNLRLLAIEIHNRVVRAWKTDRSIRLSELQFLNELLDAERVLEDIEKLIRFTPGQKGLSGPLSDDLTHILDDNLEKLRDLERTGELLKTKSGTPI